MITTLLYLVIAAIVCGVIIWLISQIPGVAPFANIIRVVVICVFVIYCIYLLINILNGTAGHFPALKP
jgi:cation transporter-like permease